MKLKLKLRAVSCLRSPVPHQLLELQEELSHHGVVTEDFQQGRNRSKAGWASSRVEWIRTMVLFSNIYLVLLFNKLQNHPYLHWRTVWLIRVNVLWFLTQLRTVDHYCLLFLLFSRCFPGWVHWSTVWGRGRACSYSSRFGHIEVAPGTEKGARERTTGLVAAEEHV